MIESKSSYRQIFKATSLFGGVQVVNIIVSIIRSKVIAVLLGPAGMGIAGLLNSTTGLVSGLTNFGLGTSAVRDVAAANETGDEKRISKVVAVFRKLVWITGFLGCFVTIVLSPWLSEVTFGNRKYTIAFIWLSVTLLFTQLTSGQNVLMQGMRKLRHLAKANLAGSITGLIISVPIYYYLRLDGIVPAIIISSCFSLFISCFYSRKIGIEKEKVSTKETILEGKGMLKMGFMLSFSGLITLGSSYILRIFINRVGGLADVGLYNAGFAIISTYVGLVFTAMSTDYYPRLSCVAADNKAASDLINQQAEIAILILAPILSFFLIFINWIVILLYSTRFIPVNGMIHWAALGMFFKAAVWSIGFILLAKGASKVFFWNELIANIYMLGLNFIGYKLLGLSGLGISFTVGYFIYLVQIFCLSKHYYEFSFKYKFYKVFSIQFLLGLLAFMVINLLPMKWAYLIGTMIIIVSLWVSFKELDERVGLKTIILNFLKRIN